MNYVGIDPSIKSTAVAIHGSTKSVISFTDQTGKWVNAVSTVAEVRSVKISTVGRYSEDEIAKLVQYDAITTGIITLVLSKIDPSSGTTVAFEGFAYSSAAGPLIDLVAFSTLLRYKVVRSLPGATIVVVSPGALKKAACEMAYGIPTKGPSRNPDGLAGGHFKKPEMMRAYVDSGLSWPIDPLVRGRCVEMLAMKKVPKPVDDIVDAVLLCEAVRGGRV